jgi:hypothetical protein
MYKRTVKLGEQERQDGYQLISVGHVSARKLTHARICLKADEGLEGPAWPDQGMSEARGE